MRTAFFYLFFLALATNALATMQNEQVVPPVIVKATKKYTALTTGPKIIITQEQIQTAGSTTLSEVLQNLGGIGLRDITGNGSQVAMSMRGFGANASSNTLLLINGIPITNPDLAPPNLNTIPLHEIEYVEILAGSESVIYGDQAVAGVINLVTRTESSAPELSCTLGSFNQRDCYASLYSHYQMLRYNVAVGKNHSDNYREHNRYDQNLMLGGFDLPFSTGRLRLDYNLGKEEMQYPGALTAQQVREDRQQASNHTDFFNDWNGAIHLKYEQKLGENWRIETDFSRREMHGDGVLTADFNQSRRIHFLRPQLIGAINQATLIAGIDVEDDRYHLASLFGVTADQQQKYGAFGFVHFPWNSHYALGIGVRGAMQHSHLDSVSGNNDQRNAAFASTLGITATINAHTKFYLRRAESFRFPKADENASTPIGVDGLKTQRGVSYETGVEWNDDCHVAKLSLYQLDLRDEIAFDPLQTPLQPFGANRNLDPTQRRGFSISAKKRFNPRLAFDTQYNYVRARFQSGPNSGNRIPLVAEHILRAGLEYAFAEHWNFYTEGLYTGNQFPANDDANISGAIGGYATLNMNLRFHNRNVIATLHVNNILNRFYYFYTVFQAPQTFFYPAPGRQFLLTIKYLF